MSLDPHIKRILDMLAVAGANDAARVTIDERREGFRKLMNLSPYAAAAIGRIENLDAPGPAGPIAVRVYTPLDSDSDELPGLVFFHGGGWVAGSLDTHDSVCRLLANNAQCRVLAVDYRLAPEHKFPAGLVDACAAVSWIFEHAAELGIDSERIAIGGDSAGAALAAVVCQEARQMSGVAPAAQLLLCPITDFAAETESRRAFAEGYLIDKATLARDLEHYMPAGVEPTSPRISPLRACDVSALPPTYIHTAECDPFRDEGKAYAQRVREAGIAVKYTCHAGMIHLFYGMTDVIPYARVAMKQIGAEMGAALHCASEAHTTS